MAFMVARTEKRKIGSLSGYQNHVDRKTENHSNKDIDNSKTHLNYDLVGHETDKSFHKEFMDYINENRVGARAVRKDAVIMQDWIIGSSQEFFDTLTSEYTRKYFETAVEFFAEKFGRENIRFATVHMDEKTPHMHMGIVPLKDGKLTAKTIFDRNCLRMIQDKLPQAFQKAGFDIQRGEPKSKKVHLQPDEFKATMRAAEEKAREIKREARKQAEEHVEWRENIETKNLASEWADEWLETKQVFPDFSMKIEVYEDDTVPRFVDVDENTPKTFKFDFEEVMNLFREKFIRLKAYIAFKWQNLSRREQEIEKRENTLIERETSLERKLEVLTDDVEQFEEIKQKFDILIDEINPASKFNQQIADSDEAIRLFELSKEEVFEIYRAKSNETFEDWFGDWEEWDKEAQQEALEEFIEFDYIDKLRNEYIEPKIIKLGFYKDTPEGRKMWSKQTIQNYRTTQIQ
ncbi:MobV family relaxase, partial [Lactococcus lactis]